MDILGIGIGPTQLIVVLIVAFFVLGPERMPEVARQLARGVKFLRGYASDVQSQFGEEFGDLRSEFSNIQEDLSAIHGNLRSGLMEIDTGLRSVTGDVHEVVQSATDSVAFVTNPTEASETPVTGVLDYTPAAVSTPRWAPPAPAAPAESAPESSDGRLPDFKPGG